MADLNKLFNEFNDKVTLDSKKKEQLRKGRNALRKRIKDNFSEKGRKKPKFCGQGSYMMKTTIKPINGEYDIDDGVYLQGYSEMSMDDWPKTNTVHDWIYKAVDGHTKTTPKNKNTCVRVIYANDYHIDLPAYIIKNDEAYLAHKSNGWIVSDPKAFTDWFIGEVKKEGEQLRRLVKYLKAWKDYKNIDLKGIAATILVADNFYQYEKRDDLALLGTVSNIIDELESNFKCVKPVKPNEDLFEETSKSTKDRIISGLKTLQKKLKNANDEKNEKKASDYMIAIFGERFPKGEDVERASSSYITTDSPAVLKNDGRSA